MNRLSGTVVDAAIQVHAALGPGLLEKVYQAVLRYELEERGLHVLEQVLVSIRYKGIRIPAGFRMDLLVENSLVLELKSVPTVLPVHKKQLLTYLRLSDKRLGLLLNFGSEMLRDGISRCVNRF